MKWLSPLPEHRDLEKDILLLRQSCNSKIIFSETEKVASQKQSLIQFAKKQQSHFTVVLSLTMFTTCSVPTGSALTLRRPIVVDDAVTMVITRGRGYYAGRFS